MDQKRKIHLHKKSEKVAREKRKRLNHVSKPVSKSIANRRKYILDHPLNWFILLCTPCHLTTGSSVYYNTRFVKRLKISQENNLFGSGDGKRNRGEENSSLAVILAGSFLHLGFKVFIEITPSIALLS